jgi:hypothetical protein
VQLKRNTGTAPKKPADKNTVGLLWKRENERGKYVSGMLLINEEFFRRCQTAEVDDKGNKKLYINLYETVPEDKFTDKSPDMRLVLRKEE